MTVGGRPLQVKVLVAGTGYQVVAITLEMVVVVMSFDILAYIELMGTTPLKF